MSENGGTLTVYQRMNDPLQAVNELGTAIAKSGMFGCGSIEQGKVLALECLARGMPPLTLAERYHVVQGKLMMKYDAMLAEFHAQGGKHKIVSRTEDKAEIQLTIDGETHTESITWEEAKKEKYPFGKDGKVKDNWATPRGRRQMLWARAVSEGVRALRPGVNNGRYVVEEIDDDIPIATNGNGQAKSASVVESATAATKSPASDTVDVEFEKQPTADPQPEFCTAKQRTYIESLFSQLNLTADQQVACLTKRKASSFRNLPMTAAAELIVALEKKMVQVKAAANAALPPIEPGNEQLPAVCGPCTPEQEKAIKAKFEEWKQIDPENSSAAFRQLVQKLYESGRQKISDLSANDAAKLYDCIQVHNMASFISRSLEEWKRPEEKANTATSAAA